MNIPLAIIGLIFIGIGLIMLPERCRHCGSTELYTYDKNNIRCESCGKRN